MDIVTRDFNYNLLKASENKLLDIFTNHSQMVKKLTQLSGSLIDHVYIKKTLMANFSINATADNINFSDHDVIKIVIVQNNVYFHTVIKHPI